jgi:hypothetical protein
LALPRKRHLAAAPLVPAVDSQLVHIYFDLIIISSYGNMQTTLDIKFTPPTDMLE